MGAIARDLYPCFRIFAALAAVLFVICHFALACRVCTFVLLDTGHDNLPFLFTEYRDKNVNRASKRMVQKTDPASATPLKHRSGKEKTGVRRRAANTAAARSESRAGFHSLL